MLINLFCQEAKTHGFKKINFHLTKLIKSNININLYLFGDKNYVNISGQKKSDRKKLVSH